MNRQTILCWITTCLILPILPMQRTISSVTSLRDIKLTAPNITAQLNQCCEKDVNIHCEEKTVKLAYMAELLSNRSVYVQWRIGERAATFCITLTIKHCGGSVMVCVCVFVCVEGAFCTKWRANVIRWAITAYCSIMQSYLESNLWIKDLYSCKIMSQRILVNSAKYTLKAKRNSTSFNWSLGRCSQQTNPIEMVWNELDWKVWAKLPTSVAHLWQLLQES